MRNEIAIMAQESPTVSNNVVTALLGAFGAIASLLATIVLRRDKRAGKAEDAATDDHIAQSDQWKKIADTLSEQLEASERKCQAQLDVVKQEARSAAMRAERLERQLRLAWVEIIRLGGSPPAMQEYTP